LIYVDPKSLVQGLDQPAVLMDNLFNRGTLAASSEAVDGAKENAVDTFTYDFWTPTALPAQLSVSGLLAPKNVSNCLCLAAHNMASKSCAVRKQKSAASRTNIVLNSENFSGANWTLLAGSDSTLTNNASKSPDGATTAGDFSCSTTANVSRRMYPVANITVAAATSYHFQVYVKAKNWTWVGLTFAAGTALSEVALAAQVNLTTGQIVSQAGASLYAVKLQNGWWKIGGICTTGASTGYRPAVALLTGSGSAGATAVGVVGAGVLVWGFHVEQAAVAGSYIKTSGSATASTWVDVTDYYLPDTDAPLMVVTEENTGGTFALTFTGANPPSIGVAQIGKLLQPACGVSPSYSPLDWSRDWQDDINRSRTGNYLGNTVTTYGVSGSMTWTPMLHDYVRANLSEFIDHYDYGKPFFLASAPSQWPMDLIYAWRSGGNNSMSPSFDEPGLFMTISMRLDGIAD
jgi:hypothetical protein